MAEPFPGAAEEAEAGGAGGGGGISLLSRALSRERGGEFEEEDVGRGRRRRRRRGRRSRELLSVATNSVARGVLRDLEGDLHARASDFGNPDRASDFGAGSGRSGRSGRRRRRRRRRGRRTLSSAKSSPSLHEATRGGVGCHPGQRPLVDAPQGRHGAPPRAREGRQARDGVGGGLQARVAVLTAGQGAEPRRREDQDVGRRVVRLRHVGRGVLQQRFQSFGDVLGLRGGEAGLQLERGRGRGYLWQQGAWGRRARRGRRRGLRGINLPSVDVGSASRAPGVYNYRVAAVGFGERRGEVPCGGGSSGSEEEEETKEEEERRALPLSHRFFLQKKKKRRAFQLRLRPRLLF